MSSVAGEHRLHWGFSQTHSPMVVLDIHLKAGQTAVFPAKEGDSTLIFLRTGRLQFSLEDGTTG